MNLTFVDRFTSRRKTWHLLPQKPGPLAWTNTAAFNELITNSSTIEVELALRSFFLNEVRSCWHWEFYLWFDLQFGNADLGQVLHVKKTKCSGRETDWWVDS